MRARFAGHLIVTVLALALTACGSDAPGGNNTGGDAEDRTDAGPDVTGDVGDTGDANDDGGDDGGQQDAATGPCTPDPELVAEQTSCQVDDHCPCGTYCDLGRCASDCAQDADCASGEFCDEFGRCRTEGDESAVPLPAELGEGLVSTNYSQLVVNPGEEASLVVSVSKLDIQRARVVSSEDVEVQCPDATEFSQDCMLQDIAVGQTVDVAIRRLADGRVDPNALATVSVHGPSNTATVSVPRADQRSGDTSGLTDDPVTGQFSGTLNLVGAGADDHLGSLPEAPIPTQFDVDASVWEDNGELVMAIRDPNGALTSRDWFIGTLSLPADDDDDRRVEGEATFPDHPFAEATVADRTHTLLSQTVTATVRSRTVPRTMNITLEQVYTGQGLERSPAVEWSLSLERTGDVMGSAPSRNHLPATLDYDPAQRILEPSPWADAYTELDPMDLTRFGRALQAGDTRALTCGLRITERQQLQPQLSGNIITGADAPTNANFPGLKQDLRQLYRAAVSEWAAQLGGPNVSHRAFITSFAATAPWGGYAPPQTESGIACAFSNFSVTYGGASPPEASGAVDFCNELRARTGCEIQAASGSRTQSVPLDVGTTDREATPPSTADVSLTLSKICQLPRASWRCSEAISCVTGSSTSLANYTGSRFENSLTAGVGELECANSPLAGGIALDYSGTSVRKRDLLPTCVSDLSTLANAAPTYGAPDSLFDSSRECLDVGRILAAVGAQSLSFLPDAAVMTTNGLRYVSAYTHRLMTRWLEVHALVASETDQAAQMGEYFRRGNNVLDSDYVPPATDEMMGTSTRGLDLFMTPHAANAVFQAPVEALLEPDYRFYRFAVTGDTGDEQKDVLAIALLQTLERQAALLARHARQNGPTNDPGLSTPDRLAEWMPRMLLAQSMASDIEYRVLQTGQTPDWSADLAQARQSSQARVLDALDVVLQINAGGNPLGISDSDLPLYYAADNTDGITDRFSAITDYIAGRQDDRSGWAIQAIEQAQGSLEAAEQAYITAVEQSLRRERVEQWKLDLQREYNDKLFDFCGPNLSGGDPSYSPVADQDFDAETCAVKDTPECTIDTTSYYRRWTESDALGRLCIHAELSASNASRGLYDPDAAEFASSCYDPSSPNDASVSFGPCDADSTATCLECDSSSNVPELRLEPSSLEMTADRWPSNAARNAEEGGAAGYEAAVDHCQGVHPRMRRSVAPPDDPLQVPGCVQGSIGEALLDVVAAESDVDASNEAISEHVEAYDIQIESCFRLSELNEDLQQARDAHYENMKGLRMDRMIADSISAGAAATKDCTSTASGAASGPSKAGIGLAVASCVAAATEAAANITSLEFEQRMENAQQRHEDNLATLSEDAELDRCFIEAKQELVGMEAAGMDLASAVFNLKRAVGQVEERMAEAKRIHERGYAEFGTQEQPPEHEAAGDPWAQAEITQYVREFRIAKRATYLSIRAVEYEYQQSLMARQQVLEAKLPVDLENVLSSVWSVAATRRINGNAANELTAVVSMRDDILRLNDESAWPDWMRPMSVEERFRTLLHSDQFAVYDDSGDYIGQRIPFSLTPLGAFGVDTEGVSIYSRTDCAERLWSIDAGIVGDAAVGGGSTVRLDIGQRNTFYSQWCTEPGEGQRQFQYASVRPTRNLFRVPGEGKLDGTEDALDSVREFSTARLQATVNTDQATLEQAQDSSGASTELATRGLYGDYTMFIDKEFISRDGSDGIDLDRVDDILLRFDYLSVAK